MAKQKDTGVYREFQSQVEQIVKTSNLKQLSDKLAMAEKAKLAELNNQAKLAANGQMLNAETEASMQKVLDGLENGIAKIAGQIQNKFYRLKDEAGKIAAEMQLELGKFDAGNLVKEKIRHEKMAPGFAFNTWEKNSTEDRRLHELTKNSIRPYEEANPNYENLNDGIINDIAEMKNLYGMKHGVNNDRDYIEQNVKFLAALNKLKTTQDALSQGLLNGMNPDAIKEIEAAQNEAGLALAKMNKAHDEQKALKEAYQNDPRSDMAKKADPKFDFTEKTTAWNDAQIEYAEAINKVEATIKRLPIVQKEAEAEIVQIKQDSAEKQSKIVDLHSKESLSKVAEQEAKFGQKEVAEAAKIAEKIESIEVDGKKDATDKKEKLDGEYLNGKLNREKQHQEKLESIAKEARASQAASTAKGALVAGAGMLGVYGVGDSIQAGVTKGVEFGSAMNLVQAIGGLSDKDKSELEANAKLVGKTTNATASEVALLQVELIKLGKGKDEIIGATGAMVEFSRTFQTDLAETASSGAKWAGVFGVEIPRMLNIMGATFRNTQIKDIAQFDEALSSAASKAVALGYSAENTVALLATAVNAGQSADEASRGMQKLITEAQKADSQFARYFGGTAKNMDELLEVMGKLTAEERSHALVLMKSGNLTEENAMNFLAALNNNIDKVQEFNLKLTDSSGLTTAAYDKSMESMKNQWALVTSAIEGGVLDTYKELEPTLLRVTKALQGYLEAAGDPDSSTARMIELVEALTAAVAALALVSGTLAGVPALITKISAALKLMWGSLGPVGWAVAGIAALATALYTWKDSAEEALEKEAQRLEMQKQNNKETTEAAEKNKALTEEYEKLAGKENLSNTEKDRMNTILSDLKKIYPDIITETNNHALALDQVKLAAEKANKELESLAGVERIRKRAEVENNLSLQNLKVDDAGDEMRDVNYSGIHSSNQAYYKKKSIELLSAKYNTNDNSIASVESIIGELDLKRKTAVDLKGASSNEAKAIKEFIANAITYRDELKKLVDTKKELAILNKEPIKDKDSDKAKDGSGGEEGTVNLDAKQQLELKLMRLKTIADIAKFESDQDLVNFEKKIEYTKANHEYQKALATQPLVNFSENNADKRGELAKAERAKLNQLEETYADDLAKIALSIDLKPVSTRKLEAQLGGLEDKPNATKYQIDLENAVYDEKVKQLGLQKDSKAISEVDYALQVRIADMMRIQNIEIAKRNEATKGLTLENTQIEIEKLKSDSLNYGLEMDSLIKNYEIAQNNLDPKASDYDLQSEKLNAQLASDTDKLNQKIQQSVSQAEILRLKVRQQESGKDYGIDRAILDEEYSAEKTGIENNKGMSDELKAANLLKAESDYKRNQEKLLSDHVNYYAEMTQSVFSTISKVADYYNKKEMDAAKKKYDYETKLANKAYNDKVKANQGANRTLAKLAEQEEKDKEAREKAWEARQEAINAKKKKWAIAETILNMTVAIAKAFAMEGPFGWAEAIALGAQLTAMTVTLASQQFAKGKVMIDTPDDPNDRVLAWFNPGESVINETSSRANAGLLNMINEANGPVSLPVPTTNHLFIPGATANNSELLAEIRQLRIETAEHSKNNVSAIDAKDWNVDFRAESKGYAPRDVAYIVQTGNKKNAKLTVWGSK